ncbi:DUF6779 domain-containing protein [uncultured Corynebacterium sp.]|uniref:DUF6779 domain-containing protein n=1 Tax=uncultured Corynebacterium sp. TaxID=159447 RepID=UPI002591CA0F|nr:DUF6779 domain-containing protein [uncultured Corynebacterium sp.]
MSAENPKSDSGNIWIVLPFALAVLGTVVMLFTNSANMLKASLILALWAAAAGIILTSRLRRDRDEAQRALADHDRRHRAELDAAKARGEADRAALALARNDEDIPVGVDVEVLREIQAELAALRAQLEEMAGRQFEYEPAALRAEARRIAELGTAEPARQPAREPEAETVVPEEPAAPVRPEEPAPAPAPRHKPEAPSQPGPSSADTTKLPPVRDAAEPKRRQARPSGAPTSEAIAGRLGTQPSARSAQHNPLSQLISERRAEESAGAERAEHTGHTAPTASTEAARHAEPTAHTANPADSAAPKPVDKPVEEPADKPTEKPAAPPAPEQRGGRRRRDERGSGALSVAELLARSKGAGEDRG